MLWARFKAIIHSFGEVSGHEGELAMHIRKRRTKKRNMKKGGKKRKVSIAKLTSLSETSHLQKHTDCKCVVLLKNDELSRRYCLPNEAQSAERK